MQGLEIDSPGKSLFQKFQTRLQACTFILSTYSYCNPNTSKKLDTSGTALDNIPVLSETFIVFISLSTSISSKPDTLSHMPKTIISRINISAFFFQYPAPLQVISACLRLVTFRL